MRVVGPELVIRRDHHAIRPHAFDRAARIVAQTQPVKSGDAPEKQIIPRIDHVDRRVAGFG